MSVLLIGCIEGGRPVTKGPATFVTDQNQTALVTCRHVIEKCPTPPFVISECRRSVLGTALDRITLPSPVFHPQDDQVSSYDIALFHGLDALAAHIPLRLAGPTPVTRSPLRLKGFPVWYLEDQYDHLSREVLKPYVMQVVVGQAPLHRLRPSGFSLLVRETQFAYSQSGDVARDGMSGGPVIDAAGFAVGMIIAGVNAMLTPNGGNPITVNGGAFVGADRIAQTLES